MAQNWNIKPVKWEKPDNRAMCEAKKLDKKHQLPCADWSVYLALPQSPRWCDVEARPCICDRLDAQRLSALVAQVAS